MSAEISIDVYGVRDALKELGQLDKKYRFQAQNRMKAAAQPMVRVAQEAYPSDNEIRNVLEGWGPKGRLGYSTPTVNKGVQVKIGGKSYGNAFAIVTLVSNNPGAALFDIAGLQNGNAGNPSGPDKKGRARKPVQSQAFIDALNRAYGKAQRGVWRKRKQIFELAEQELLQAIRDITAQTNRKLVES